MKTNVKIRTDKRKPIKNDIWMKKVWRVGEPQVSAKVCLVEEEDFAP